MARKGSKQKSGGVKGFLMSATVLVMLFSALFGVAKVNDINSIEDLYEYIGILRDDAFDCGLQDVEWNCKPDKGSVTGSTTLPNGTGGSGDSSSVFNPSKPGITEEMKTKAPTELESVKVGDPVKAEYSRSDWKHWTGSPCNSRIQILQRDGENVDVQNCKVVSGKWKDPYSDFVTTNSSELDIDHIVPLSYANKHGASTWNKETKEAFANDPINLTSSSAKENRKKSDSGPADYMPPEKGFHCSYSNSWINIVKKYDLTITAKDKKELEKALLRC